MGDSPAAVFFARTFRRPIQRWLDKLRAHSWGDLPPPSRASTYTEWISAHLAPRVLPDNLDEYIWPSEDMCAAWTPVLQRPVPLFVPHLC
eukprot:8465950-Pyramimonas_sp.AAC.1